MTRPWQTLCSLRLTIDPSNDIRHVHEPARASFERSSSRCSSRRPRRRSSTTRQARAPGDHGRGFQRRWPDRSRCRVRGQQHREPTAHEAPTVSSRSVLRPSPARGSLHFSIDRGEQRSGGFDFVARPFVGFAPALAASPRGATAAAMSETSREEAPREGPVDVASLPGRRLTWTKAPRILGACPSR